MTGDICIILGTRPEIIKMSPVVRACERRGAGYFMIHTGQHYSYNLDRVFFEQLGLPDARYNLDVGSGRYGEQTGRMLAGIEGVLMKEKPDAVLAGVFSASKLGIKIGHVEAGLRSYDWRMPEETGGVPTAHCSDYLIAPTEESNDMLVGEDVSEFSPIS